MQMVKMKVLPEPSVKMKVGTEIVDLSEEEREAFQGTIEQLKKDVDEAFGEGKQAEYEAFWNINQQYGKRTDYGRAYGGVGWTNENFNPLYIVRPTTGNQYMMFAATGIETIDETKVDTSQCTGLSMSFYSSSHLKSVTIDISSLTALADTFNFGSELITIVLKNIPETCNFTAGFNGCSKLTELTVTGVIGGTTLNLQWSPLSVASMKNILLHLKNHSGTDKEGTCRVIFTADCWAALEADSTAPNGGKWADYVDSLGWLT